MKKDIRHLIDTRPTNHVYDSMLHQQVSYPSGISELVDNSLDQGATEIEIGFDGTRLWVSDDGAGCSNINAMIQAGNHCRTALTKIGQYGIGLKEAATGLGSLLEIKTVKDGVERCALVDWQKLATGAGPDEATEDETTLGNQTTVTISQLHKSRPQLKSVEDRIGYNFAPAMWAGKQIRTNFHGVVSVVSPWTIPEMSDAITAEGVSGCETFGYKVRAGLVGHNDGDPFVLSYQHRIIGGTSEPCKSMRQSSRFLAFVELWGHWPLLKHKDGVQHSEAANWLYDQLYQDCFSLLQRVQKEGESLLLEQIASELEMDLGFRVGRQKRERGETEGTNEPKGTKRKMREAEIVQHDNNRDTKSRRRRQTGIDINYDDLQSKMIGKVDSNEKRINVILNRNHPFIAHHQTTRDRVKLKQVCVALLAGHQSLCSDTAQQRFSFESEDDYQKFIEAFSSFMSSLAEEPSQIQEAA